MMSEAAEGLLQSFSVRQEMCTRNYEIFHYKDTCLKHVELHHHDFYEVYLFLDGAVDYIIENRHYHLLPGDILLISPMELHHPYISQNKRPYERFVLWIDRNFIEQFCTSRTALTHCFDTSNPRHANLLRLSPSKRQYVTELFERLAAEFPSGRGYGADLSGFGCFLLLLVELNRQAAEATQCCALSDKPSSLVTSVLDYINEHYCQELSLNLLAEHFFVNKYHLSHEFNRMVGTSIYRYIIQKRLAIAKKLLSEGQSPTEVYKGCGFGDYSNFYRAFTAEYGISPKVFAGMYGK